MSRIYFDHNATSPLRPEARQAFLQALEAGNASSVHAEGRAARSLIESARVALAATLGTKADRVVFVSGATEAANMALQPSEGRVPADRRRRTSLRFCRAWLCAGQGRAGRA